MIRSIIKSSLYTNYRICCKRSLLNAFQALSRLPEVVLRNCTTNNNLLKYVWSLHIARRPETHLNMSILSVSAGLFLMFAFYVRILAIVSRNGTFGLKALRQLYSALQHADNNIKVLIAHTIDKDSDG